MNLVIRNTRLIDGTGADPVPRVSVEVTNGVINWIEGEAAHPRGRVHLGDINGEGLTLIPGMISCHEHLAGDGGLDNADRNRDGTPSGYILKATSNARRLLMSGVTSVRDTGSPFGVSIRVAEDTASGALVGPRIIAAGEWLSFPGSTWRPGVGSRLSKSPENLEELVVAIRELLDMGAGLIKVGANGTKPNGEFYGSLGPNVLAAVVQAAHEGGVKIAAHCLGFEASRQAVEAGIDSVEHGTHLDEETVRLMAKRGTFYVPTLSPWYTPNHLAPDNERNEFREYMMDSARASFRSAMNAGVRIATGTDAGGSHVRHGFVAKEIELMVEAGMSPRAALESSTRVAADLMGILDQVGTIEPGKQADMVLIDGDPHSDPAALRNIWAIFQGGTRVL